MDTEPFDDIHEAAKAYKHARQACMMHCQGNAACYAAALMQEDAACKALHAAGVDPLATAAMYLAFCPPAPCSAGNN